MVLLYDIQVDEGLNYIGRPIFDYWQEYKGHAQEGASFGQGAMSTPEGLQIYLRTRGRDDRALPRVICSSGFQGQNLIQVGESYNIRFSSMNLMLKKLVEFGGHGVVWKVTTTY